MVLTKPIGTGVISTAIKRGEAKKEWIDGAVASMTKLNRRPVEVVRQGGFEVHAATDITGFGLLGHLRNITAASKVSAQVFLDRVPVLPAAREYVQAGIAPGGTYANQKFLAAIHCNLGLALNDVKDYDQAVAHHQQALDLKSDLAEAHANLGNVQRALVLLR